MLQKSRQEIQTVVSSRAVIVQIEKRNRCKKYLIGKIGRKRKLSIECGGMRERQEFRIVLRHIH